MVSWSKVMTRWEDALDCGRGTGTTRQQNSDGRRMDRERRAETRRRRQRSPAAEKGTDTFRQKHCMRPHHCTGAPRERREGHSARLGHREVPFVEEDAVAVRQPRRRERRCPRRLPSCGGDCRGDCGDGRAQRRGPARARRRGLPAAAPAAAARGEGSSACRPCPSADPGCAAVGTAPTAELGRRLRYFDWGIPYRGPSKARGRAVVEDAVDGIVKERDWIPVRHGHDGTDGLCRHSWLMHRLSLATERSKQPALLGRNLNCFCSTIQCELLSFPSDEQIVGGGDAPSAWGPRALRHRAVLARRPPLPREKPREDR